MAFYGNTTYSVKLEVFEGPMDLLIHLVRKNDIDIYDIPISLITNQYYEYISLMQSLDMNIAGEFLILAATLSHIKSKMLLPSLDPEEEEDPRLEIARPLIEYLQLKQASESLVQYDLLGRDTFISGQLVKKIDPDMNPIESLNVYDLVLAYKNIVSNQYRNHTVDLTLKRQSVKDRIIELTDLLSLHKTVTFSEIFLYNSSVTNSSVTNPTQDLIVITFLAILEMGKLNLITINQQTQDGIIRLFYV